MNKYTRFNPEYIAKHISKLTGKYGAEHKTEIEDAIYQLKAIADNEYNHDFWRVFYRALECIAAEYEAGIINI